MRAGTLFYRVCVRTDVGLSLAGHEEMPQWLNVFLSSRGTSLEEGERCDSLICSFRSARSLSSSVFVHSKWL